MIGFLFEFLIVCSVGRGSTGNNTLLGIGKQLVGDIHPDVPVSPPGGISTIGSLAVLK